MSGETFNFYTFFTRNWRFPCAGLGRLRGPVGALGPSQVTYFFVFLEDIMKDFRDPVGVRNRTTDLSNSGKAEPSVDNRDEQSPYLSSFTKGLAHGLNGLLVDPADYETFAAGTKEHDPTAFERTRPYSGPFYTPEANALADDVRYREWESPTAGHAYENEGPDPQAIPMPPAPKIGSSELAAEIAEVYQMALSRDWGVAGFMDETLIHGLELADGNPISTAQKNRIKATKKRVDEAAKRLSKMRWFDGEKLTIDTGKPLELARRRFGETQTANTLFRGKGEDPWPRRSCRNSC